jgi:cvfA/B/C family virulence factor
MAVWETGEGPNCNGYSAAPKKAGRHTLLMTSKYQIIYWRDIPAQIKVRSGAARASRSLSDRFQQAIDEAAMREGLIGTDGYLAMWRTSQWIDREGEAEEVAAALILELEAAYPQDRLTNLIAGGGYDPAASSGSGSHD